MFLMMTLISIICILHLITSRRFTLILLAGFIINPCYAEWSFLEKPEVQSFIEMMVHKHGFNRHELMMIFDTVKTRHEVIQQVSKPLEKEPWHTYQLLFVNEWRIQHGVEFWNKYANVLKEAERLYGVPASIIVATIGIETKYGEHTGGYRVIDSLTNLAFSHSPRAYYFRGELEQFLLLTRDEHLDPMKIMGSYAGAFGQPQFMPSSYRNYAVNFSRSGKTDIVHNEIDVIGSIANYYHKHGWMPNQPVAIPAVMIGDRYHYLFRHQSQPTLTMAELARYGVVPKRKMDDDYVTANVIELESRYSKEYWIGFHNFNVIKRYNPSDLYAMAVFQLSSYITSLRERLNNG